MPPFLSYIVKPGDNLETIAKVHGTDIPSLSFWNRDAYPSLDPDSPDYRPNRIEVGWVLRFIPNVKVDPEDFG
jgi:hypothetical protein